MGSLIPIQNKSIVRVEKTLAITNKIIFSGIEKLFNEGFYLLNSKHLERSDVNYCFLFEYDKHYYRKNDFNYEAISEDAYHKAIEIFSEAIRINPSFEYSYIFRGIARSNLGDIDGSVEDYSVAIDFNQNNAFAYFIRGETCCMAFPIEAIEDFSKAIEIDSLYEEAYQARGYTKKFKNCYNDIDQYQDAINDLTKAIELNPNNVGALYGRADINSRWFKNYKSAIKDFSKIIELEPTNAEAYFNRAHARNSINDQEGARKDFERHNDLQNK